MNIKTSQSKSEKMKAHWASGRMTKDVYTPEVRAIRRRENGGSHTFGEWETLKAQYNWICPCCREPEKELVQDHIIPLAKGGSDNIENIQPLCRSCNAKKHTAIIRYEIEI